MKYMTEYQLNYQKRQHQPSLEERKLDEVPRARSASPSYSRRRPRPPSPVDYRNINGDYAVIGPHDKFSQSYLHRLKQPVADRTRAPKSREYAILGRNEKLENNIIYPLRQPVLLDSPKKVIRRRKKVHSSVGIQTEARRAQSASHQSIPHRRGIEPKSEYKTSFDWKQPAAPVFYQSVPIDEPRSPRRAVERPASSPSKKVPKEKTSIAVNTPAHVQIDVEKKKTFNKPTVSSFAKKKAPAKRPATSEYQARYRGGRKNAKPIHSGKSVEDERAVDQARSSPRKPSEVVEVARARSDDEVATKNVDLGKEFRQRYPHGKLRRWKSEYRSTYKPFWRYDYKDGQWYKDSSTNEQSFNPNLFWYKELMSTRKRANEFRAKAETDHFNPQHTLQLSAGFNVQNPYQAWDTPDADSTSDSVISIDRELEGERLEGEQRREKDAQRVPAKVEYRSREIPMSRTVNQHIQTEKPIERVIYIDEPAPRIPSAATRAFVRNLSSTSVQQHMNWESESLHTQRTNSDLDFQSLRRRDLYRKLYPDDDPLVASLSNKHLSPSKRQSRGTGTRTPPPVEDRTQLRNAATSPRKPRRFVEETVVRPRYETPAFEPRPIEPAETHGNQHLYPSGRFKDEVTEYYYADNHQRAPRPWESVDDRSVPVPSRYTKYEEILPAGSARSLSTSSSLALQTLERAQHNKHKYWDK